MKENVNKIIPSKFIIFLYEKDLTGLAYMDLVDLCLDTNGKLTKFALFIMVFYCLAYANKVMSDFYGFINAKK